MSHLTAVKFRTLSRNRHQAYRQICHLSPWRVVVLKQPGWFTDTDYPQLPNLDARVIALARDAPGVVASWQRRRPEREPDFLARRWAEVYRRIFERTQALPEHRVALVRHEDILADPVIQTARLFAFIGSVRTRGTTRTHRATSSGVSVPTMAAPVSTPCASSVKRHPSRSTSP